MSRHAPSPLNHTHGRRIRGWRALACVLVVLTAGLASGLAHAGWFGLGSDRTESARLSLATWNLEWLMTPQTHADLSARCQHQQPRSHERALPCTPGRTPPPARTASDLDALARTAQVLHQARQVDVVALQEVDGPDAARQVFRQGWKLDCFVRRAHPQKVGFAIRAGVPYRCNGDLDALDVDGSSRAGADLTLYPGTAQEVRLLNVHLKSGCFQGKLDRRFGPCHGLQRQAPVVEAWIDQRVRDGVAFAVLGDFNRHLDQDERHDAGPDESAPLNLMSAWSDDQPRGAVLHRATAGQPYLACDGDDRFKRYVDDILLSERLKTRHENRRATLRLTRLSYDPQDRGRQLSDHCPLIWSAD